jgi:hypothetical protein
MFRQRDKKFEERLVEYFHGVLPLERDDST